MPQQTVYIRNADMIKWKALENKAAFISEHLNNHSTRGVLRTPPEYTQPKPQLSIPSQLEELGLKYDHTIKKAYDPSEGRYIDFKVINGEVIL